MTMEANGQKAYEFYDGDFYFYTAVDDCDTPSIFRVRIDNSSPEERHQQNITNHNRAQSNPKLIRPSTESEISLWLKNFEGIYPVRHWTETFGLRRLALGLSMKKYPYAFYRLKKPKLVVRDFQPQTVCLIEKHDGKWRLTETGKWLTTVML